MARTSPPSSSLLCRPPIGISTINPPPPPPTPPPPPPLLEFPSPHSPVGAILKEEQGECTEKLSRESQGKHSSRGTWKNGMAQIGVELILTVDKWDMGWREMYLG